MLYIQVDGAFSGATKSHKALSFGLAPGQQALASDSQLADTASQQPVEYHAHAPLLAPVSHETQHASRQSSEDAMEAEDEEDVEREDDRANDPACIECDDGGSLMPHTWRMCMPALTMLRL